MAEKGKNADDCKEEFNLNAMPLLDAHGVSYMSEEELEQRAQYNSCVQHVEEVMNEAYDPANPSWYIEYADSSE